MWKFNIQLCRIMLDHIHVFWHLFFVCLPWRCTLKDYLEADGFQVAGPRDILKQAFQSEIIKNGHVLIEALDDRDLALLIYEEEIAINMEQLIREKYYPALSSLIITLKNKQNDFQAE